MRSYEYRPRAESVHSVDSAHSVGSDFGLEDSREGGSTASVSGRSIKVSDVQPCRGPASGLLGLPDEVLSSSLLPHLLSYRDRVALMLVNKRLKTLVEADKGTRKMMRMHQAFHDPIVFKEVLAELIAEWKKDPSKIPSLFRETRWNNLRNMVCGHRLVRPLMEDIYEKHSLQAALYLWIIQTPFAMKELGTQFPEEVPYVDPTHVGLSACGGVPKDRSCFTSIERMLCVRLAMLEVGSGASSARGDEISADLQRHLNDLTESYPDILNAEPCVAPHLHLLALELHAALGFIFQDDALMSRYGVPAPAPLPWLTKRLASVQEKQKAATALNRIMLSLIEAGDVFGIAPLSPRLPIKRSDQIQAFLMGAFGLYGEPGKERDKRIAHAKAILKSLPKETQDKLKGMDALPEVLKPVSLGQRLLGFVT